MSGSCPRAPLLGWMEPELGELGGVGWGWQRVPKGWVGSPGGVAVGAPEEIWVQCPVPTDGRLSRVWQDPRASTSTGGG